MTARAQIHRLVDALPDDALDTVERMLAQFVAPAISHQAAAASPKAPTEDRPPLRPTDAAQKRLHSFFRRSAAQTLA